MALRPRLSLKARALQWLAQREHSRTELRRKLLRAARDEQRRRTEEALASGDAPQLDDASGCEACVDKLLDWLQAQRYLSEERFVESRVHARAARYGNLRIRQELAQHGVQADAALLQRLGDSELQRARDVWRRKFDALPADAAARARQMRFLLQRGFSPAVVQKVLRSAPEED